VTISVLLPSRGRPDSLLRSIDSLRSAAARPNELEILVASDLDDPQTAEVASKAGARSITMERVGYAGLHHYVNELAMAAQGDWLALWNDDAYMETPNWDELVSAHEPGCPQVLSLASTGQDHSPSCFPIISRALLRVLGCFSLSPHCDTWVEVIGREAGCFAELPIHVRHERYDLTGDHDDATYRQGLAGYRTESFYGPELTAKRNEQIAMVKDAMYCNGSLLPPIHISDYEHALLIAKQGNNSMFMDTRLGRLAIVVRPENEWALPILQELRKGVGPKKRTGNDNPWREDNDSS
jgi:glycosyltransferase involved in cell wall biosynthesis